MSSQLFSNCSFTVGHAYTDHDFRFLVEQSDSTSFRRIFRHPDSDFVLLWFKPIQSAFVLIDILRADKVIRFG